ncbi:MAG: hypothetical protein DCC65_08735 [Planctomycetota bacterium]|nr:MAG: hypothetical protein DCC65_08735 [Planctomycetota bacterium]
MSIHKAGQYIRSGRGVHFVLTQGRHARGKGLASADLSRRKSGMTIPFQFMVSNPRYGGGL